MVTISWTAEQFEVKRVLLNSELTLARAIRHEAELLGLPVLMDNEETSPKVGDLWVGLSPKKGWGDVAGECAWARTSESTTVLARLNNARVSQRPI